MSDFHNSNCLVTLLENLGSYLSMEQTQLWDAASPLLLAQRCHRSQHFTRPTFANLDLPRLQFRGMELDQTFIHDSDQPSVANLCVVIALHTLNTGEYSELMFSFQRGFLGFKCSWCTGATQTILISLDFWLCPDFEKAQQATWLKLKAIKQSFKRKKVVWVNFALSLSSEVLWCNISCLQIFGCCLHALLSTAKPQMEIKHLGLTPFLPVSWSFISYLLQPEANSATKLQPMSPHSPSSHSTVGFWGQTLRLEDV